MILPEPSPTPRDSFKRKLIRTAGYVAMGMFFLPPCAADDNRLTNPFHDPMLQLTGGIPSCPVPEVPLYTQEEFRDLAHERSQRGVSCWLAGRCRLPSGYLYDAEIIPRVGIAVTESGLFSNTSVWALGQRRRVWLRGCVATAEQLQGIEVLVRQIDDVEDVQNELAIGDRAVPTYLTTKP